MADGGTGTRHPVNVFERTGGPATSTVLAIGQYNSSGRAQRCRAIVAHRLRTR